MPAPYVRSEQVATSMTPRWVARLDAYADRHEVSRSEAMRRLMEAGIAADESTLHASFEE